MDFSLGKMTFVSAFRSIAKSLSARPAESIRLTDPGCPIASLVAIHSLLALVFARKMPANTTLRRSLFAKAAKAPFADETPNAFIPSRTIRAASFSP